MKIFDQSFLDIDGEVVATNGDCCGFHHLWKHETCVLLLLLSLVDRFSKFSRTGSFTPSLGMFSLDNRTIEYLIDDCQLSRSLKLNSRDI